MLKNVLQSLRISRHNADGKLSYNLAVDETLTGGTISGTGTFEKTGNANLTINGDNSGFTGTTNIEDGKIIFDKQTANDIYLGGTTNINLSTASLLCSMM